MNNLLEMITSKQVAQDIVWMSTGPESLTASYKGEKPEYYMYVNSLTLKNHTEYNTTIMKRSQSGTIYSDKFVDLSDAVMALCMEVAKQYNESACLTNKGIIMENQANQVIVDYCDSSKDE